MRQIRCTTVAAVLIASGSVHAGPVLIDSFDYVSIIGSTDITIPRVGLGIGFSELDQNGFSFPLLVDTFLGHGDIGAFEFRPETNDTFDAIAVLATNGADDLIGLFVFFEEHLPGLAAGNSESFFLQRDVAVNEPPDLVGYELENIRLVVNGITIEDLSHGDEHGFLATVEYAFEFHGALIPEPSTLVLLGYGLLSATRKRFRFLWT